ncbi:MAG: CFI-box-CTERM domain-containing protein [Bacteriovoracia bacterium]
MSKEREAFSKNLRSKIKAQIDLAQEELKRDLFRRRIEVARQGIRSYEDGQITEAVKHFHMYLRILEEWKKVPEWGLTPGLFDMKADQAELLLISGVYWDMAKIYDRTRTESGQRDFRRYLEKYVLFSTGMPFQALCAEAIRKYSAFNKGKHKAAFKAAYKRLAVGKCFVATELYDELAPSTLPSLRDFRDETLARSRSGRAFTAWYYRHGEQIAEWVARKPAWFRSCLARILDWMARSVRRPTSD